MIANALNLRDCAHPARSAASPSLTLALGGEDGVGSEGFLWAQLWRCTDQQAGRATAMGGHQVGSSCISTNTPAGLTWRLSHGSQVCPCPSRNVWPVGARRPPGPAPVPPGAHWCRGPRELARWPRTSGSDWEPHHSGVRVAHAASWSPSPWDSAFHAVEVPRGRALCEVAGTANRCQCHRREVCLSRCQV